MRRSCLFFVFCPTTFARFLTCWLPFILSHSFTFFQSVKLWFFCECAFSTLPTLEIVAKKSAAADAIIIITNYHLHSLIFFTSSFHSSLFCARLSLPVLTRKKAQPHTHTLSFLSVYFSFFPFSTSTFSSFCLFVHSNAIKSARLAAVVCCTALFFPLSLSFSFLPRHYRRLNLHV